VQEAGVGLATKVLHKMGVRLQDVNALHNANALDEERTTFTCDGEKVRGFASSVVPTLEEKTISEHPQPHTQQDRGATSPTPQDTKQEYKESIVPEQNKEAPTDRMESAAGVETDAKPAERLPVDSEKTPQPASTRNGELVGPPATAPKTDDAPRQVTSATNKLTAQEEAALPVRPALRKYLNADLRSKTWALPVPAPNVDPHGFDDPLADSFWKDMWVASAVHNVRLILFVK
jgi:phospholipase D1/2